MYGSPVDPFSPDSGFKFQCTFYPVISRMEIEEQSKADGLLLSLFYYLKKRL